jgi:hypothetical protein
MSDINTTPLVDVMLVLLIIFLIAVPVVIQTVPIRLPKVAFEPTTTKPENVSLSVIKEADGSCGVYWNLTRVTSDDLLTRAVDTRTICPKFIFAAISIRRTSASAAPSLRCSARAIPRSGSFPSLSPVRSASVVSDGQIERSIARWL